MPFPEDDLHDDDDDDDDDDDSSEFVAGSAQDTTVCGWEGAAVGAGVQRVRSRKGVYPIKRCPRKPNRQVNLKLENECLASAFFVYTKGG